jgi:hypothetical protein
LRPRSGSAEPASSAALALALAPCTDCRTYCSNVVGRTELAFQAGNRFGAHDVQCPVAAAGFSMAATANAATSAIET